MSAIFADVTKMQCRVFEDSLKIGWDEMLALLSATRGHGVDGRRLEWLYGGNPDGEAVVWGVRLCRDPHPQPLSQGERGDRSGELAGFTAALPRRMWVDGEQRVCWNCADFSMHPKYRTLGPAVKLRRAAKEGVDAGRVDFLYAHPNERMAVIHKKVGHKPVGRMVRYARPLRTASHWGQKLGSRVGGRLLGGVVDPLLRLAGRELRHRSGCRVRLVENVRFDERFDRLFEEQAPRSGIIGVRDARYLNWRYADNPLYQTDALLAEQGGQLRGYLLFMEKDEMLVVKDVFPSPPTPFPGGEGGRGRGPFSDPHPRPLSSRYRPPDGISSDGRGPTRDPGPAEPSGPTRERGDGIVVVRDLVAAAVREGYRRGLTSVSFTALESNPLLPAFEDFGFRVRPDGSQMFAYAPAGSPLSEKVCDAEAWYLTVGDRDV